LLVQRKKSVETSNVIWFQGKKKFGGLQNARKGVGKENNTKEGKKVALHWDRCEEGIGQKTFR